MSKASSALDSLAKTLRMKIEKSQDIHLKELELEERKFTLEECKFEQMLKMMANQNRTPVNNNPNIITVHLDQDFGVGDE